MQIQSNLGSTIAMAFDECIEDRLAERTMWRHSCDTNRLVGWSAARRRCIA